VHRADFEIYLFTSVGKGEYHKLVQYRPTILGDDINEATGRRTEKGIRVTFAIRRGRDISL
jgi:hypothetical protein